MGKHILVVDDTVSLLAQVVEVLTMEGYYWDVQKMTLPNNALAFGK